MAERLRSFDFTAASSLTVGDKGVYPWEEWLNGDIWKLTEGVDFTPHPLMMERIIRTRATQRSARVTLRHQPLNGDPTGIIVFQRVDVKGPAERKAAAKRRARAATKHAPAKKAPAKRVAARR